MPPDLWAKRFCIGAGGGVDRVSVHPEGPEQLYLIETEYRPRV